MSGLIPRSFIDELIHRSDIVQVISPRVTLKKAGKEYSARCPFHNENSPSFTVSPQKQFYHCFGCGEHGNALDFLIQYERLDFVSAVETLAALLGMEVPREQTPEMEQRAVQFKHYHALLHAAATFYTAQLSTSPVATDYLRSRQLESQIIQQFEVGYAPDQWDTLLKQIGTTPEKRQGLLTTGMLIHTDEGRTYDRFRGRITFPIHDARGRVIGFGGRALGDEKPKYLNSPETPTFHKGRQLYGLYQAITAAKHSLSRLIVVEGYMDVLMLAQYGFNNAVATLGTAITPDHLQLMFKHCQTITFCFDGDKAGYKAAWRALETAWPLMNDGLQLSFVFLPEGQDPDSFVTSNGQDAFQSLIDRATPLSEFFFEGLSRDINTEHLDGRAQFARRVKDYLKALPKGVFYHLIVHALAERLALAVEELEPLITPTPTETKKTPSPSRDIMMSPGRSALSLLLQYPEPCRPHLTHLDDALLAHTENTWIKWLMHFKKIILQYPTTSAGQLAETWREYPDDSKTLLAACVNERLMAPDEGVTEEFAGALQRLIEQHYKTLIQTLLTKSKGPGLSTEEKATLQQLILAKKQ